MPDDKDSRGPACHDEHVHWTILATFWSQILLGVVGAVFIYFQLGTAKDTLRNIRLTQKEVEMPIIVLTGLTVDSAPYGVRQEWTNKGDSRADDVEVWWSFSRTMPGKYSPLEEHYDGLKEATLAKETSFDHYSDLPPEYKKEKIFYIYGLIEYRDTFLDGGDTHHKYGYSIKLTRMKSGKIMQERADKGNCYDSNCGYYR